MKQHQIKRAQTQIFSTSVFLKRQSTVHETSAEPTQTGRHSQENQRYGFRPAFIDVATGTVYRSCFADGHPAPFHLLEGLPDDVVAERDVDGQVTATKSSLIAGFVRHGRFYSREEAAGLVSKALRVSPHRLARLTRHFTHRVTAIARMGRAA